MDFAFADLINCRQQGIYVDVKVVPVWPVNWCFIITPLAERCSSLSKYSRSKKAPVTCRDAASCVVLFYTAENIEEMIMQVNDRVTVKTDGGPRRSGVVLAIESFSEGTMYLVSLEDYPLGIWFFNEIGHPDGIFVEKEVS